MARSLPPPELAKWIASLSDDEAQVLLYDWEFWARPDQELPPGAWQTWLVLAGRGFGKTRTGAEAVRKWVRSYRYVNLIAATGDDARDIMVEGESGILACCPRAERPYYRVSKRRLEWPNGARSLIFTADEPERLRGKQHEKLWADELAAWRYPDSWDQAMMGLRLGRSPQCVVTTTPRPTPLIKQLIADPNTYVTRGSTYDNRANLAPQFFSQIIRKYEGTRLGRQELNAEILDDNPGALWHRENIDAHRVREAPQLSRIVVGLDPAVTSDETSDETGIIVVGVGADVQANGEHFYVLRDASLIASPMQWAKAAVEAYHVLRADRIIGETNNGGDMIEALLRQVDMNVSYRKVTATRGKAIRAEPIAALYEQGRVHHVNSFPQLEDQMCEWDPAIPGLRSPDRMDALVWALTELSDQSDLGLFEYYRQLATSAPPPPVHHEQTRTVEGWPDFMTRN